MIAGAFATAVAVGTALLSLPAAATAGRSTALLDALFTATSAVCVTGLVVVDTGAHWSTFGELVILGLIQVGGLGIMTLATLFTVLLSQRFGLRARFLAQAETKALELRDIGRLIRRIAAFLLGFEAAVALVLAARLAFGYGEPAGRAAYLGVFHAVAAVNNAGMSPHADSLVRYAVDPWICLTVSAAVIVGGLGFPVVFELARQWRRPRSWSVLTRITLTFSAVLLAGGTVVFAAVEWGNPATFGPFGAGGKVMSGFFASVQTRSAGFNTVDVTALRPESVLATDVLMFIGGGSAGTSGGIKVTTFGLLAYVMWAEMRNEPHVSVGYRRIPAANQRQALTVALLGVGLVVAATFALLGLSAAPLDRVLFEAISAFGTVGLSNGLTAALPPAGQLILVALMFLGRTGPLTVAAALALREHGRRYTLPEERTIVG
ncbi:potassium transporter Trk [Pilimelia terevasa]|uniref:Potassium transporter Trk n=1 Tax=Pilimelia terevasa TaxID=53372 RepID=A0A8J3BUW9_9ACTN|nr:potassium transporter Trk [Pilimelia terevasa]